MSGIPFGYFTSGDQTEPVYDPGLVACPVCGEQVTPENVHTVSLMHGDSRAARSLFYRLHRTCNDSLNETEKGYYDSLVLHPVVAAQADEANHE